MSINHISQIIILKYFKKYMYYEKENEQIFKENPLIFDFQVIISIAEKGRYCIEPQLY